MLLFSYLVFFSPNYLSHPDNYTIASVSVTPAHLVPEWYFLPFYAALRSTPDKFGGLLLIFLTLVDVLLIDAITDSDVDFLEELEDTDEEEIENDEDLGILVIIFFLGGSDIDEPYTDLTTIPTFLQFMDYFDLVDEDEEYVTDDAGDKFKYRVGSFSFFHVNENGPGIDPNKYKPLVKLILIIEILDQNDLRKPDSDTQKQIEPSLLQKIKT